MTAPRPAVALLLLACSSSGQPLTFDAAPTGDGPAPADGPAPLDVPANISLPPDLAPDLAPDLNTPADLLLPLFPDALSQLESGGSCTAPPGTYGPFPDCAPSAGPTCDPVCQSGCGCGQRCAADSGGLRCQAQAGPFVQVGGSCSNKDDRCKPGLLCLQESVDQPACGAHCYRHCRSDAECLAGSKCIVEVQFGGSTSSFKLCSAPADACQPWGAGQCATPRSSFGCYVMSQNANVTTCECAGTAKLGSACLYEHECEPGTECMLVAGTRTCRKVCSVQPLPPSDPGSCPAGQLCKPFPGSAKFGYCQ